MIVTPPKGLSLPRWSEVWEAREVLWRFGLRDVVLRYRQTVVGVAWVIIQPLMSAGVFTIIFGNVADLPSGGMPYFLFTFAGMLGWNLFGGVVERSAPSLVANQSLVAKVFFPRMLVPMSSAFSVLIDFVVALGLMVVLLVVFGVNPGWAILTLPIWVMLAVLLGLGIGLAASTLLVRYRDVGYVLPWLLQLLFFATPVAYSLEAVPEQLEWLFTINPLSWLMESYRWALLGLDAPPLWQMLGVAGAAIVVMSAGLLVYQRFEREFADVI
ncbi:ABC transporter permease [Demequina sp. NBRC 110053]|uniref:ABC transporter permease n=1 Tax=Demequina sp. NBRC 110053 TaxID=1570342 RepID=UPI0013563526|nr:ABC transporter permease [Demequina sp. NBRC 110053]